MKRGKPIKRRTRLKPKAAKPKRGTVIHRQEVRAERVLHREETDAIFEAVARRAGGTCECSPGCEHPAEQMDHAKGRTHAPQSVQNCWLLSGAHHLEKTLNRPSRLHWLELFLAHCERYGYREEAERVANECAYVRVKTSLPAAVR